MKSCPVVSHVNRVGDKAANEIEIEQYETTTEQIICVYLQHAEDAREHWARPVHGVVWIESRTFYMVFSLMDVLQQRTIINLSHLRIAFARGRSVHCGKCFFFFFLISVVFTIG